MCVFYLYIIELQKKFSVLLQDAIIIETVLKAYFRTFFIFIIYVHVIQYLNSELVNFNICNYTILYVCCYIAYLFYAIVK